MNLKKQLQNSKELEAEALKECDKEQIHIPGYIQSYGAILAFDFNSLKITHASANIHEFLDVKEKDVLGLNVKALLGLSIFHSIANIASHNSTFDQREHVTVLHEKDSTLDLSLFRSGESVILEMIPITQALETLQINSHLLWALDTFKKLKTVDEILEHAVKSLREITQFDRAKAYRFHPDESGEVVAESNNGRMDSFLGLHFPAFDIPPIARKIFSKISIRHIYNTSEKGVKVNAAKDITEPLNLTQGILRGNSQIHNQYLQNMGVSSTLTLPIIVNKKLWGLFALHHQDKKQLSSEINYTAELFGQLLSILLEKKIENNANEKIKKLQFEGETLVTLNENKVFLKPFWENYAKKLAALIKCDGLAYQIGTTVMLYGDCPSKNAIFSLAEKINEEDAAKLFQTSKLTDLGLEGLGRTAGLLLLPISPINPALNIYFFRNEIEQQISWAGNPKKNIVIDQEKVRLHPRGSFTHFKELNKGCSEMWDSEDISIAEIAIETFKKALAVEIASNERHKIVVQELNHRLRNILTLVRSISKQSAHEGKNIGDYVDSLEQRIVALANANNLLTESAFNSVELKDILESIIHSLCSHEERVHLNGPLTKLVPDIVPMIVLIIHELTTNSIKYGALSSEKGSLNLDWKLIDKNLVLTWKEKDGPTVREPDKVGFGTVLIQDAINYEFGGTASLEYQEDGLLAQFKIPDSHLGEKENDVFVFEQMKNVVPNKKNLEVKKRVLIVEDDFLNAKELKEVALLSGLNKVDIFSNQKNALIALKNKTYDLALVDVNLKNETSIDVALKCQAKGIPFMYITGYGASFIENKIFPKAPVLIKPVDLKKLKIRISTYLSKP